MPLPLRKKPKSRRVAPGKIRPVASATGRVAAAVRKYWMSVLIGVALWVALTLSMHAGREPLAASFGEVVSADIRARVPFSYYDSQGRQKYESLVRLQTRAFTINSVRLDEIKEGVSDFARQLRQAEDVNQVNNWLVSSLDLQEDALKNLKSVVSGYDKWSVGRLIGYGCLKREDFEDVLASGEVSTITLVYPDAKKRQVKVDKIANEVTLKAFLEEYFSVSEIAYRLFLRQLFQKELTQVLTYSREETDKLIEEKLSSYKQTPKFHERNNLLVPADTLVGIEELDKLKAEQAAFLADRPPTYRLRRLAGAALLVALTILASAVLTYHLQPVVLKSPIRLGVLSVLILMMLWVGKILLWYEASPYLIPISFMAIVLAIAYDRVYAISITGAVMVLIAVAAGNSFRSFIVLLSGAFVAASLVSNRIRKRSHLLEAGIAAGIVQFGVVWGFALSTYSDFGLTSRYALYGLVNCFASVLLVSAVLPLFERFFGVTTEISLLELSDLTQPLLHKLALEAPGTYNHSLIVGSLAESAARAIGANDLLARVGAYFHDIGKLNKPEYFVENRGLHDSKHSTLSPSMSALVITAHTKDGVEMADEFRLPVPVREIVAQHHGNTMVQYFYDLARRQQGNEKVDETPYRYSGPRPQFKEAAIVMLADAIESASRTLSEPHASRIESLVDEIIAKRLDEGELTECNLTFKELRVIRNAFVKTLQGIFHSRIKYPGATE